jgi:GNAT superfamily N-acetyltransferase
MTLTISTGNPAPLAKQALKYRLYDQDGALKQYLRNVIRTPKGAAVTVLQGQNGVLHGVCLISDYNDIMAYVQPDLRGQGWGTRLIDAALSVDGRRREDVHAGPGKDFIKSVSFWRKCQINCGQTYLTISKNELIHLEEHNSVLVFRAADKVAMDTYESLYTLGLYEDNTFDDQNGLRGRLAAIWNENLIPFDYILYHATVSDVRIIVSLAMICERNSGSESVLELQFYVKPIARRTGYGQAVIDRVKQEFPGRRIVGHYTPSAAGLLARNQIEDIKTHTLDPWTITSPTNS